MGMLIVRHRRMNRELAEKLKQETVKEEVKVQESVPQVEEVVEKKPRAKKTTTTK